MSAQWSNFVWNVKMYLLHSVHGFVINTKDKHFGRYSLLLILLNSSMAELWLIVRPAKKGCIGQNAQLLCL